MIPLKQIHIPAPCHESWEGMTSDAQARFCAGCRKCVHNLSEMSRDEAQAVIARADEHVCVRFFPGADGRPLTREDLAPPTPAAEASAFSTRGLRRLAAAASWAVAVLTAGLGFAQAAQPGPSPMKTPHRYTLGQFTVPKSKGAVVSRPGSSARPGFDSGPSPAMMGGMRPLAPVTPPPPAVMGDIALPRAMMGEIGPTSKPGK